ncbi:MAG: class I SAM-dependent methyltransferase [Minisyncoccota bacterium]
MLVATPTSDYELLDTGNGMKLERYGVFTLARPDPQALWIPSLPQSAWQDADGVFAPVGPGRKKAEWKLHSGLAKRWQIKYGGLDFWIKPSAFKHTGLFPEQAPNWDFIRTRIVSAKRPLSVINLFGYTGGATLAAAQAGAEVVHVDGSKSAIGWARDNAKISGLENAPIRWILDDARAFLRRELKRGHRYDGIIMDPPSFGHGPAGEVWKIEEHFLDLLSLARQVLSVNPIFFIINGYASGYSPIAYENNLRDMLKQFDGTIESGELTIEESTSGRLLPAGIFARWKMNR